MIPIITSRIDYKSIEEADDKADRDRQYQLKVSDDKRRRMKAILNENTAVKFNKIKNKIHEDHDSILHNLKNSYFKVENDANKNTIFDTLVDQISSENILHSHLNVTENNKILYDSKSKNDNFKSTYKSTNNLSSVEPKRCDFPIENKLSSLESEWLDVFEKENIVIKNKNFSQDNNSILPQNSNKLTELNSVPKSSELIEKLPHVELNSSKNHELTNLKENSLLQSHSISDASEDKNFITSDSINISSKDLESKAAEKSILQSLVDDVENIILNSAFKKNSNQILLAMKNIEKSMNEDNLTSFNLRQSDLNDLISQFDFLEGYMQSGGHANEIQNKILDTLNISRSHLIQIANNNLLEKDKDLSVIENNPMLLGNAALVMSPQLLNLPNNKNSSDNAMNKNNQINGIVRLQQKNKDDTLSLVVQRSV